MNITKDNLKPFQVDAIQSLSEQFLTLWKTNRRGLRLIFKSPTGSGKTIMMAEFISSLDSKYNFDDDKCYVWISFGDDTSYLQSKKKFLDYYKGDQSFSLKDKNDLTEGKMSKNNIFFINWSSIKASDSEGKLLRRENEDVDGGIGIFDRYIINTKNERDIVLIIDEAHTEASTALADEIMQLLDPRIIIKVTATPKEQVTASDLQKKRAGYVEVDEADVIASGLIKEKLIIQTKEDIESYKTSNPELSIDQILMHLAYNKRKQLEKIYDDNNIKINPLVLIQLPNDYKESSDVNLNSKELVLKELKKLGVNIDEEVAIWLDKEKTEDKLKTITNLDDQTNYLIFKVAPATGWDCPRASILVMYREIQSPTFRTQILGRIKRMPYGNIFKNLPELNKGYIFTNYTKNDIRDVSKSDNPNSPNLYFSHLKENINQIALKGSLKVRTGYNTITPPTTWQLYFMQEADTYFGTDKDSDSISNIDKIKSKIDINKKTVSSSIIIDAEIESFDRFIEELKEKSKDENINLSQYNIEKLYNLLCFNFLKDQKDEAAKYNVARSWRTVKSAINAWFTSRTEIYDSEKYYPILVNDLLQENSHLKMILYKTLIRFRGYVGNKTAYSISDIDVMIPVSDDSYNGLYEEVTYNKKYALDKLYLKKEYDGRENEINFIKYIDSLENIEWWFKQADLGSSVFGCRYINRNNGVESIFNPDFIIKTEKYLYLLDAKNGITARDLETADKCRDLQEWIRIHQKEYLFKIVGGIIKDFGNGIWKINSNKNYDDRIDSQWENLEIK